MVRVKTLIWGLLGNLSSFDDVQLYLPPTSMLSVPPRVRISLRGERYVLRGCVCYVSQGLLYLDWGSIRSPDGDVIGANAKSNTADAGELTAVFFIAGFCTVLTVRKRPAEASVSDGREMVPVGEGLLEWAISQHCFAKSDKKREFIPEIRSKLPRDAGYGSCLSVTAGSLICTQ